MVVFQCESCGDSIKKPKVAAHYGQCAAAAFTCIDCSRTFDRRGVAGHTSCVTEHEKYAQGATKPGGFAAAGFYGEGPAGGPGGPGSGGANGGGGGAAAAAADGAEYLATRPPWTCACCNVSCTSAATLAGHAAGLKHRRRARAAAKAKAGGAAAAAGGADAAAGGAAAAAAPAPAPAPPAAAEPAAKSAAAGGKAPKWKKLAAAQLKAAGGKMKVKALLKALLPGGGGADADAVLAQLRTSKKFELGPKTARLAAAE